MNTTQPPGPDPQPNKPTPDPEPVSESLEEALGRLNAIAERSRHELETIYRVAGQHGLVKKECNKHPGHMRSINDRESVLQTREAGDRVRIVHLPCELCQQEQKAKERNAWLIRCGVPEILASASWETWKSRDVDEAKLLEHCKKFATGRAGFLVLSGPIYGNGKSFAAVCIMREFRGGTFRTQTELLSKIRANYGTGKSQNIVDTFKQTKLLVLDDVGTGGGYRDELPLIHEILDYRHGHRMKTVLTTNLNRAELAEAIGARMADRFRASAHLLDFKGKSRRAETRGEYFGR